MREIKDDKIALINEVADKHNEFLKHRTVNNELETSLRYLKMKLDKKSETIEQLNKDLKVRQQLQKLFDIIAPM
jgi:prefoldin subunit 5